MRGKDIVCAHHVPSIGITPAYAGKSPTACPCPFCQRDHPRICGEKFKEDTPQRRVYRITPAYAGKRGSRGCWPAAPWDHPRICGEKPAVCRPSGLSGSPPHMRGKAALCSDVAAASWITPAYAGKRLKRSRSTVPPVAIVPLFPSVCNKPVVSDGSPAGRDAPLFLPAENAVPASPAYNLRSL